MSDFKERLRLELRTDVPFTKEIEERIIQNEPPKKKKSFWPMLTSGALAVAAAALLLLSQNWNDINHLYNGSEITEDFYEMKTLLIENEVKVPLLSEVGENQQVITDADAYFSGYSYNFLFHDVIVEEAKNLDRGDYILFELENGEKYVRQLVGFGGEAYKLEQGNVFINDQQLILPGFINGDAYIKDGHYWDVAKYFVHLPNNYNFVKDFEAKLEKNELLIKGIDIQNQPIETIKKDQVVGKVVGVKEMTPTFVLTGEAATIYESFKRDLDTSKLVGLDPVTILRMYKQAELEREFKVMHALMPSTASIYNYDVNDIKHLFNLDHDRFGTERERRSIMASYYNGLADATYKIITPKKSAEVYYYYGKVDLGPTTQKMYYNEKFWEYNFNN